MVLRFTNHQRSPELEIRHSFDSVLPLVRNYAGAGRHCDLESSIIGPRFSGIAHERACAAGLALGDDIQFQEALALIEESLKNGGLIEDQRAKVVILATRPRRRSESIRDLENLIGKQTPSPDEQFLLAQLYEAERNWPRARVTLLSLMAAGSKDPRHLTWHV